VPLVSNVKAPPLVTVHTDVVEDVNVTARPELAVAVSEGELPSAWEPGLLNVIV
jgi:hypothetical protein